MQHDFSFHKKTFLLFMMVPLFFCFNSLAQQQDANKVEKVLLDKNLKPSTSDEISTLFENVVAVQRKAKVKSGKFLFSPYLSFDFSDSPYTMYGLNLNFGYAAGEYWEFYLNYVPVYTTTERSISKKVKDLGPLQSGLQPEISMEKAKSSYGFEVNWVPIYGKDSWGAYKIIRSDTFLNLGASQIKYSSTDGMKYKFAIGKTFFIADLFNLRLQAGGAYVETITSGKKDGIFIGLLEGGLVYYF